MYVHRPKLDFTYFLNSQFFCDLFFVSIFRNIEIDFNLKNIGLYISILSKN